MFQRNNYNFLKTSWFFQKKNYYFSKKKIIIISPKKNNDISSNFLSSLFQSLSLCPSFWLSTERIFESQFLFLWIVTLFLRLDLFLTVFMSIPTFLGCCSGYEIIFYFRSRETKTENQKFAQYSVKNRDKALWERYNRKFELIYQNNMDVYTYYFHLELHYKK